MQRVSIRHGMVALALVVGAVSLCGCQSTINGQTLPTPYHLQDDVSYSISGPEFKLPREAAGLQAARQQEKSAAQSR